MRTNGAGKSNELEVLFELCRIEALSSIADIGGGQYWGKGRGVLGEGRKHRSIFIAIPSCNPNSDGLPSFPKKLVALSLHGEE